MRLGKISGRSRHRGKCSTLKLVHAFTRKQRLLLALVPPAAALLIRALGATLRYRDVNAPDTPVGHTIPGPSIFAFWHCALLVSAHRFRDLGIAILISRSFDGELIARTVERLGFVAVRGSSSRGTTAALRGMVQAYAQGRICAFTADGPRGPARIAKPGPAHLAELAGAAWIGAFHAEASRAWHLGSWDRFMIPKPFATVTFAWPAHRAPDTVAVQQALDEAVRMAASGG
jgi:hypothetical protein